MNFSSNNNNAAHSNHPTPVSSDPQTDPSVSFEQYRSPLVNTYFVPNYATLRVPSTTPTAAASASQSEPEEPPQVPPLPVTPTLIQCPITVSPSPLHYRSLQSTPVLSASSKMVNLGNYFPHVATDAQNRTRYHTAPREKHRVSWSISCVEVTLYIAGASN